MPWDYSLPSSDCVWLLFILLQGFTKKLQSELIGQYTRKVGSSGGAADAAPAPFYPSGGSSASSSTAAGAANSASASSARMGASGSVPSGLGSGSSTVPVGFGSSGVMGSSSVPTAASNLSALKMSVNTFTRELASSMSISRGNTGDGGASPHAGGSAGSSRDGKATLFKPGGLNFNMQQTAARTREGLAKLANLGKQAP